LGEKWSHIKVISLTVPYALNGDPGYQNTMEFLAVALSVCVIRAMGYDQLGLDLIGDNTTSLSWAKYNRFKRGRSLRTTLLFMRITSVFGMRINFADHLAGERNTVCDALSRGVTPQELGFIDESITSVEEFTWIGKFLDLCNPTQELLDSEKDFISFWVGLSEFCSEL